MKNTVSFLKPRFVFLALSMVELLIWFVLGGSSTIVVLSLPMAAVLFGLYLIFQMMEKETELYDQQHRVAREACSRLR